MNADLSRKVSQLVTRVCALVVLPTVITSIGCDRGGILVAHYPGFDYFLESNPRELFGYKPVDLHIQTADGRTFYLPQITIDDVENKIGCPEIKLVMTDEREFAKRGCSFQFRDGSLVGFNFHSNDEPGRINFLLSRSADGPFVPMPKTKEELIALFGEPDRWARARPATGP